MPLNQKVFRIVYGLALLGLGIIMAYSVLGRPVDPFFTTRLTGLDYLALFAATSAIIGGIYFILSAFSFFINKRKRKNDE